MKTQMLFLFRKSIVIAIAVIVSVSFIACNGSTQSDAPKMDLQTAALMGNMKAVQQHIANKADINQQEPTAGSTPLITATLFGHTEIAKALIEAGADINYQNKEGSTALHTAAFFCRTEIVKLLLEHGADKSVKNVYGSTPFESVAGPYADVQKIYEDFGRGLMQLGLKLDYKRIESTRPTIAELLK